VREVMLASTNGQPEKMNGIGGEAHAVMAEVVALRAILLNVLFKQAKGEPLTAEEDAAADRPGRLGQAEKGARKAGPNISFPSELTMTKVFQHVFNSPVGSRRERRKIALTGVKSESVIGSTGIAGPVKNWLWPTLVASVLAFVAWIGIFTYQSVEVWTPCSSGTGSIFDQQGFSNPGGTYQVLSKLDRQGQHSMATDADVMPPLGDMALVCAHGEGTAGGSGCSEG